MARKKSRGISRKKSVGIPIHFRSSGKRGRPKGNYSYKVIVVGHNGQEHVLKKGGDTLAEARKLARKELSHLTPLRAVITRKAK